MFNTLISMGKTIKVKAEKKPRRRTTKEKVLESLKTSEAVELEKAAEGIEVEVDVVMFEGAEVLEVLNQINATTYACQMSDGTTKAVQAHLLKGLIDEEESEM